MLARLAAYKVNVLIVFVGAPLIIFLIKLTPLILPPQYYFNFSNLVARGSEPFIAAPPGITGAKLCELMRLHHISESSFEGSISCTANFEEAKSSHGPLFSKEEIDEIYTLALRTDAAARGAIAETGKLTTIAPLSDDEIRAAAAKNKSVSSIFEALYQHYDLSLSSLIGEKPRASISNLYSSFGAQTADNESSDDLDLPNLPDDVIERAVVANRALERQLTSEFFLNRLAPMKKSAVDDILKSIRSREGLGSEIVQYYQNSMAIGLRDTISHAFENQNLGFGGKERDREIVFAEINKFSIVQYITSILVRLAPVFLFGLVVGLFTGRGEILSISLAGGLAAFLLSWPLMLMWDNLVSSSWADKKSLFLAMYSVYVIAFFVTARSGGMAGVWLGEKIGLVQRLRPLEEKIDATVKVTWREVVLNISGAAIINIIVFAWNVVLPVASPVKTIVH
jgi:hypothetical protein